MFDHPGYVSTGTLFFHDRLLGDPDNQNTWWHDVMQGRHTSPTMATSAYWLNKTQNEMESGVVVVDKSKKSVLIALLFVAWMNSKGIRDDVTYRYTYGTSFSGCLTIWFQCLASQAYYVCR